jgi:hypothetical protein
MMKIANRSMMQRRSIAKEKSGRITGFRTGITPPCAPSSFSSVRVDTSVAVLSVSLAHAVAGCALVASE